jgi:hypothetical protein
MIPKKLIEIIEKMASWGDSKWYDPIVIVSMIVIVLFVVRFVAKCPLDFSLVLVTIIWCPIAYYIIAFFQSRWG